MNSHQAQEESAETALIRVPKDIRDRLAKLAAQEGRSIGKQAERLIEEPLRKAEAGESPA